MVYHGLTSKKKETKFMFKSLFDWLVSSEPVSRWVLILMILGLIVGLASALKNLNKHEPEGEQ